MSKINRRLPPIILIAALTLAPLKVLAFSGTGQGTVGNPYKIATCEQLQDIENDLDAYYVQTGNIDCAVSASWNSGAGFEPISTFTGSYDGKGYSIDSIAITQNSSSGVGLFSLASGATITNIHFNGGYIENTGSGDVGAIAGGMSATAISNCSVSSMTITGIDGGGMVGYSVGGSINKCWLDADVNLSGYRYTGGITGLVMVGTTISNIYSAGNIGARGGLIGVLGTGTTLTNSYSTATVNYPSTAHVGGLIGSMDGVSDPTSASNLFFDGTVTGGLAAAIGEIVGAREDGSTLSSSYFMGSGDGIGDAAGGSGTATALSIVADYFENNDSVAPLTSWDFVDIWQITSGYPNLIFPDRPSDGDGDNYSDTDEDAGPNTGDGNDDGILDRNQTNVTTIFNDVSDGFTVLESDCDSNFNTQIGGESSTNRDIAFDYPAGLVGFVLLCNTPGATANVTLYFYGSYTPSNLTLRKWNSELLTYSTMPGASMSNVTIGGMSALKVQYQITDGSAWDEDGVADGNIVDPVGVGIDMLGAPNTGFGSLSQ